MGCSGITFLWLEIIPWSHCPPTLADLHGQLRTVANILSSSPFPFISCPFCSCLQNPLSYFSPRDQLPHNPDISIISSLCPGFFPFSKLTSPAGFCSFLWNNKLLSAKVLPSSREYIVLQQIPYLHSEEKTDI